MKRFFSISDETPLGKAVKLPTDDETLPNGFYGPRAVWFREIDKNRHPDTCMDSRTTGGHHVLGAYNIDRRTNANADTFETHVTLIGPDIGLDIGEMYLTEQNVIYTFIDLKGLPEGPSRGMAGRPLKELITFDGPFSYLNDQIINVVFPKDEENMRFWLKRIEWKHPRGKEKG